MKSQKMNHVSIFVVLVMSQAFPVYVCVSVTKLVSKKKPLREQHFSRAAAAAVELHLCLHRRHSGTVLSCRLPVLWKCSNINMQLLLYDYVLKENRLKA